MMLFTGLGGIEAGETAIALKFRFWFFFAGGIIRLSVSGAVVDMLIVTILTDESPIAWVAVVCHDVEILDDSEKEIRNNYNT
jgi:hypothetical protein